MNNENIMKERSIDVSDTGEISLFDIVFVLIRRKFLFISIVIICLLAGIVYSVIQPKIYKYTQFIQLAGYRDTSNGKLISFRDSKLIQPMINGVYIPSAVNAYNFKHEKKIQLKNIKALVVGEKGNINNKAITNPNFVILYVEAPRKLKQAYAEIFTSVLAGLNKNERGLISSNKGLLTEKLTEYQNRRKFLSDYYKKVLDFNKFFSAHMLTPLYGGFASAPIKNKTKSDQETSTNSKVLMRALTQQSVSIVSQNKLFAEDRMHSALQEKWAVSRQIANTKFQLSTAQPSHFFSDLQQSQDPVGLSAPAKIILFLIFGVIVGFFVVFLLEFIKHYKKVKDQ